MAPFPLAEVVNGSVCSQLSCQLSMVSAGTALLSHLKMLTQQALATSPIAMLWHCNSFTSQNITHLSLIAHQQAVSCAHCPTHKLLS